MPRAGERTRLLLFDFAAPKLFNASSETFCSRTKNTPEPLLACLGTTHIHFDAPLKSHSHYRESSYLDPRKLGDWSRPHNNGPTAARFLAHQPTIARHRQKNDMRRH